MRARDRQWGPEKFASVTCSYSTNFCRFRSLPSVHTSKRRVPVRERGLPAGVQVSRIRRWAVPISLTSRYYPSHTFSAFVPDKDSELFEISEPPVAQVTLVDRKGVSNLPAELGAVGEACRPSLVRRRQFARASPRGSLRLRRYECAECSPRNQSAYFASFRLISASKMELNTSLLRHCRSNGLMVPTQYPVGRR